MQKWSRPPTLYFFVAGFMVFWLIADGRVAGDVNPTKSVAIASIPLFNDVTHTHLPSADLHGLSMDARFADVDQDDDLDLIIANEFRPNLLLLNDGAGRFTNVSATHLPQTRRDSEDVGVADFDRDGDLDIVIVSEDDQVNELYLNDGHGRFADASVRISVTGISNAVLVTDIDLDGDADILIGNKGQNVVLINNGTGFFTDETAQRLPLRRDVTQDLELGDVDGDSDRDLLVGNEGANRLLINIGGGFFRDASADRLPLIAEPEETREADFGDIDGDGDLDIMTANLDSVAGFPANTRYRVYLNDGQGAFTEATDRFFSPDVTGNGLDIEAADVNGDERLDLYLTSRGGTDRLLLNRMADE